jgi:hypothetical protein
MDGSVGANAELRRAVNWDGSEAGETGRPASRVTSIRGQ